MDEIYELKKALLMERRERARALYELCELQLSILEREQKEKSDADSKRQAPAKSNGKPVAESGRGPAAKHDA